MLSRSEEAATRQAQQHDQQHSSIMLASKAGLHIAQGVKDCHRSRRQHQHHISCQAMCCGWPILPTAFQMQASHLFKTHSAWAAAAAAAAQHRAAAVSKQSKYAQQGSACVQQQGRSRLVSTAAAAAAAEGGLHSQQKWQPQKLPVTVISGFLGGFPRRF